MLISQNDSKRITVLRFPLMIFIVLLHSINHLQYSTNIKLVETFFTQWGVPAVYIFFLISGYLLFLKNDSYLLLLKKKARALLLPYLLWPTAWLLILILSKLFLSIFFSSHLKNPWIFFTSGWKIIDYLKYYFFYDKLFHHPYWAQFWFIRQLMLLVIITPVISFCTKHFASGLLLILLSFVSGVFPDIPDLEIIYIYISPVLFFYIGALCARYNYSFFDFTDDKFKWIYLIPLFIFFFIIENILDIEKAFVFYKFSDFIRCIIILKSSRLLITDTETNSINNKYIFKLLSSLSIYSFFLYAIHFEITIPCFSKIYTHFISLDNDIKLMGHFFFVSFNSIIFALITGYLLKRFFPKVFSLLCGGR